MTSALPQAICDAIESLSNLPGIGTRSAERLVFSILKNEHNLDRKIADSIGALRQNVAECETCCHFCDRNETQNQCEICQNPARDHSQICVVQSPTDVLALERTGQFRGQYHVLHGVISPLGKVAPENIRIPEFLSRAEKDAKNWSEVVLALPGNVESEATAHYIFEKLRPIFSGKITMLARGIPSGGELDFLDGGTIGRAMAERRDF